MKLFWIISLLFCTSCANYVNSLHRQIDREEGRGRRPVETRPAPKSTAPVPVDADRFGHYRPEHNRFRPEYDKRPIKNPLTYSLGSETTSHVRNTPKRDYRPQRYQARDFVDNDDSGSLWANQGNSSSLFTYQNDKQAGDIVIINVLENLRNQISAELKRTFPDRPKKTAKDDRSRDLEKKAPASQTPAPSPESEMDMKVYDKISGMVMEELNKDYVLLRGRKDVIFKSEKRSIEVQAVVSRRDILENDYVNSDKLLESRVIILKDNQ